MHIDPIQATDFYKVGHKFQYPVGIQSIYSNFTPRSNKLAPKVECKSIDRVVFVGLQGFCSWYLQSVFNDNFFYQPKEAVINRYAEMTRKALGEAVDTSHIAALHDLGYLPIEIKALPEGSRVPMGVPMFTVKNTHPEFYWLVNYLETVLSDEIWKPCTVASIAHAYRQLLTKYADITGAPHEFIDWQGHDFSMRGMSGMFDAASSGFGHLTSFLGTDTIPAIGYAEDYYGGNNTFVGGSVPASEHSVLCAGGEDNEKETIRRLITEVYPNGVVSIVSDTWDYWNTITVVAKELKQEILDRKPNALGLAKVVFRPDSGDPVKIICGTARFAESIDDAFEQLQEDAYGEANELTAGECGDYEYKDTFKIDDKYYDVSVEVEWNRHDKTFYFIGGFSNCTAVEIEATPEVKGTIQCLWETFGGTITDKGYKVLNERVGVIYGDSITLDRAAAILKGLEELGFASCNIVFGIGSFTYQYLTRDTFGFAMKATAATINGEHRELFKDPKTGDKTKKSAKGLLRVERDEKNGYILLDQQTKEQEQQGELTTVFYNGRLVKFQTLEQIRAKVRSET
jgi:nicotinamide phosphoribosyltransferase